MSEGLEWAKQSRAEQVFVVPYLFFTGILMKKIERLIKAVSGAHDSEFILCRYLGYHPMIEEIFHEKITEIFISIPSEEK